MYEPGTTRLFHEYLEEGDSCVIAGAHQGYFTLLAALIVGPKGRVYAFEPEPQNFAILKQKTEVFDNIELFQCALGDRTQRAPFFFNSDNDGGHALWDVRKMPGNSKSVANPIAFEVDIKLLDDVLEGKDLSHLKLMLFDVEGAEHALLKGAINTVVDNQVPYIITEINCGALRMCLSSQMELRSYMGLYGYRPYIVNETSVDLIPPEEEIKIETKVTVNDSADIRYEGKVYDVFNIMFKHLTAK